MQTETCFAPLPASRFDIIYCDCPWLYFGSKDKDQAAGKHYDCLSYEELATLPVQSIATKNCVCFMWATGPKLAEAVDLLRAWGFHYRGIAFDWHKTTRDGKVISAQGVRPSIIKQMKELVIVGSIAPKGRPLPLLTEKMSQDVHYPCEDLFEPRPGNVHSRKPASVRTKIVELYGDIPRIELFARQAEKGWACWGLQAPVQKC